MRRVLHKIMNTDPTKIDLDLDPMKQRMSGIPRHGYTPFDVPYISQIKDNLWQGGCQDGLILPEFIKYVFSVYQWEQYTIFHKAEVSTFEMYDSEEQGFQQVDEIAKQVVKAC